MSLDKLVAEYESRLNRLRHWPDREIIHDLTAFAVHNEHAANHIADILISRIIDPSTNLAFKVPLFYLVDSVMKNGSPRYANLFSSHIVVVFQRTFVELNDIDKARLDFLLSTWEERGILPPNMLMAMRDCIGTRIVNFIPPAMHAPVAHGPGHFRSPRGQEPPMGEWRGRDHRGDWDRERGHDRNREHSRDRDGEPYPRQNPRFPRDLSAERDRSRDREERRPRGGAPGPGITPDLRRAMEFELDKMYTAMRSKDRLPLEQLSMTNPELYMEIKHRAEMTLNAQRSSREEQSMNLVNAFICEHPVVVDISVAENLVKRLRDWDSNRDDEAALGCREASHMIAKRLESLLPTVKSPPPIPDVVTGPLSDKILKQREAEVMKAEPVVKLPVPKFRVDLLSKPPKDALKALYEERSFYCRQDGSRFKSQADLASHLDHLFVKNQERQRREGKMTYRPWYCKETQWITDFGSLRVGEDGVGEGGQESKEAGENDSEEEMVVPADEHFTRCPVSNEAFLPEWDTEEGDYMYRNAVKVLVTEVADKNLFGLCQVTSHPLIRYAIVHQKLVMEGWLSSGKALTLRDAFEKISNRYGEEDRRTMVIRDAFVMAAGEDEDEEDIFVLVEKNSGEIGSAVLSSSLNDNGQNAESDAGAESKMDD